MSHTSNSSTAPVVAAHTPGPWSIIQFGGMQIGHKPTGEAVCTMWGSDSGPSDPKLANAHLIAAAPQLLEAAQDSLEALKLLRIGMALYSDKAAVDLIDTHIAELECALTKARGL